jgi:subtilase family protein
MAGWAARLVLLASLTAPPIAHAGQPFIWDDDGDGLDDRMESVQLLGYRYSFEGADTLARQRFEVERTVGNLVYGVYVVFKSPPSLTDLATLGALGMPSLHRFEAIPAVRSVATFAQAQAAKALLLSVERIEVVPLLYPATREDAASVGAVDPSEQVFPTWAGVGGGTGHGVVVAILDTGINDAAEGPYPGHESLVGRRVGGAVFTYGDSAFDTPRDGSVDPVDRGGPITHDHGTHVAGIVLGSGGGSGYAPGLAPAAEFVDVKVLDDAGFGTGVAEALDWCIHNRSRNWGGGAAGQGMQVINLSLSSLDESDGNDVPSRLAARATELGIVVVASVGNESADHHIPSPAGGDGVLAVGAYDAQRTPRADDDVFASFSDRGPRASDGDLQTADEQKPDLVAPGVAVLSADGDLTSDGTHYKRMSGTSMAAAVVSGAVAALRSEFPSLAVANITALLHSTARRVMSGVPSGPAGSDPRWRAAIGWGALDLYAARLELLQPERSQVRRLALVADTTHVTATLWTQRERGASYFVLERAPDAGGAPGAFVSVDSVATAGDSSLAVNDLTAYVMTRGVPLEEHGVPFWYRISFTEGDRRRHQRVRYNTPARRFTSPVGTSAATIQVRVVHDAYDHDIDAAVRVGGSTGLRSGPGASVLSSLTFPLPGTSGSVSSDWVTGVSTTGTIAWDFAIEVPAGAADAFLPPSSMAPWRLEVAEGGYLNRSGRIESYQIVWHGPSGDETFPGWPLPLPTVEGQTVVALVPQGAIGVTAPSTPVSFSASPSPVRAGRSVTFVASGLDPGPARVFDLGGRIVASMPFVPEGGHWVARWNTSLASRTSPRVGVYFVRAGFSTARIVVLGR